MDDKLIPTQPSNVFLSAKGHLFVAKSSYDRYLEKNISNIGALFGIYNTVLFSIESYLQCIISTKDPNYRYNGHGLLHLYNELKSKQPEVAKSLIKMFNTLYPKDTIGLENYLAAYGKSYTKARYWWVPPKIAEKKEKGGKIEYIMEEGAGSTCDLRVFFVADTLNIFCEQAYGFEMHKMGLPDALNIGRVDINTSF